MSEKKVAVVTGANKGIGFEISRQLGFRGFKVYMCGRNHSRLLQSSGLLRGEGHDVVPYVLDVTDFESITGLVNTIKENGEKLDALVNNAAVLLDEDLHLTDVKSELVIDTLKTNTIAPLILTNSLLEVLNENSRVVMLSSGAGTMCGELRTWAPVYSISKTALNAVTRQLAHVLAERKIAVNAVTPGWVQTDMGGSSAHRTVKEGAETPIWLATEVEIEKTGHFWRDKKIINW